MTESLTLENVLKRAVNKEIEAQRFYIGLSEMVNDSIARDAFQMLSREEKVQSGPVGTIPARRS